MAGSLKAHDGVVIYSGTALRARWFVVKEESC